MLRGLIMKVRAFALWLTQTRRAARRAGVSGITLGLTLTIFGQSVAAQAVVTAKSPLDPLSRDEILAAVAILSQSGKVHPSTRFAAVTLHEPTKNDVLATLGGDQQTARQASVAV